MDDNRRSLPERQPARALAVVGAYVVAVAVGSGLLLLRSDGQLPVLLSVMWALALLVPLAVLAPRPAPDRTPPEDPTPVLRRPSR